MRCVLVTLTAVIPFGAVAYAAGPIFSAAGGIAAPAPLGSQPAYSIDASGNAHFNSLDPAITVGGVKLQQVLSDALAALPAVGGDASATVATASYSVVPRTAQDRASTVVDLRELGARGDAQSSTAALNHALAIAAASPGTTIYIPNGIYALTINNPNGFEIPTNTTIMGAGLGSTTLTWNDDFGGSLFTSLLPGGNSTLRISNIVFQNFSVRGQFATLGPATTNGYPFIMYNVDGLIYDHIGSTYSRTMAMVARGSSDVVANANVIEYSARDGINFAQCTNVSFTNNIIEHIDDDAIAAHSSVGEPWGARRNIVVTGNRIFDAQGIKILGARTAEITGNIIDNVRAQGIDVSTSLPNGGTGEGVAAGVSILITGNAITDVYSRALVDGLNQGSNYIKITGDSARAGNYGAVPGTPDPTGLVHNPYPEFAANSSDPTVPTNPTEGIVVSGNYLGRIIPQTDGTDPRFTSWTNLGFGTIFTRSGTKNPSLPLSEIAQTGIYIGDGTIRDVIISNNILHGLGTGLSVGSGDLGDIVFRGNVLTDIQSYGILLNGSGKADLQVVRNLFDMDPYFTAPSRGKSGTWAQFGGPTAIYNQASTGFGLQVDDNIVRNAFADSNVSTSNPPASWLLRDNIVQADPVTIGSYDNRNKGVGLVRPTGGFVLEQQDSDPTSPTYGQILTSPASALEGVPTTGKWIQGTMVRNTWPSGAAPVFGWMRVTSGTTNVLGTDWVPLYGGEPRNPLASLQTGSTSRTLTASDCGTVIRDTGSVAHAYSVPLGLPLGCTIKVLQLGAATISINAASGLTMEEEGSSPAFKTTGVYALATLLIDSLNTALLRGDVN